MSTEVVKYEPGSLQAVRHAPAGPDRLALAAEANKLVEGHACPRPYPAWMDYLPWSESGEDAVDAILLQLITADDPDKFQQSKGVAKAADVLGKHLLVNDVQVRPSTTDDGWGAYLMCDVTDTETGERFVLGCSAKQAATRIGMAAAMGELPVEGSFVELTVKSKGKNAALGFIVESAF